ncbi:MAG: FUSC family protein, partial [Sarcina sp.]
MKKHMMKILKFLLIILYLTAFKVIFGTENMLLGITTIVAMKILLKKDLTLSPVRNTLNLIIINIFIGIMTTLGSMNVWLSVPVNFIAIFILGYTFCYSLSEPVYLPFILEYLLLLTTPISFDKLPIRFLALITVAVSIMISQIIFNRDRVSILGNKILINICDDICKKIECIKNGEDTSELDSNIRMYINSFRKIIYDKREKFFYLTDEGRIKLNSSVALEKINILLNKLSHNEETIHALNDVEDLIEKFKEHLLYKTTSKENLEVILKQCREHKIENIYALEILSNIIILYDSLYELNKLGEKRYNEIENKEKIPNKLHIKTIIKKSFSKDSIKFCYSIRVALGVTLAYFIITYFKVSQGRWILLTVFSLINPIYEVSKRKVGEKFIETILGALVIMIAFTIFKDIDVREVVLLIGCYFITSSNNQRIRSIFATVLAIGIVSISSSISLLSINRIVFVGIGAIMAMLINKFILPFNVHSSNKQLVKMYKYNIYEMLNELAFSFNTMRNEQIMKNLFINTSLIEDKLKENNEFAIN